MKTGLSTIMLLLLIPFTPIRAMHECQAHEYSEQTLNIPIAEVKEFTKEWADHENCTLLRRQFKKSEEAWYFQILCKENLLSLRIVPDSSLATKMVPDVKVKHHTNESEVLFYRLIQFIKASHEHLEQGYLAHKDRMFEEHSNGKKADISEPNRLASLASCVLIFQGNDTIQVSGLFLPQQQAIVTTAHDVGTVTSVKVIMADGTQITGSVTRIDRTRDLTLISLDQLIPPYEIPPVWRETVLGRGERVHAIGCPLLRHIVQISGSVEGPINVAGQILWQVKMLVEPGSSGSPVFDEMGRVVGIIKGRLRNDHSEGFIIPTETVRAFLSQKKTWDINNPVKFNLPVFKGFK